METGEAPSTESYEFRHVDKGSHAAFPSYSILHKLCFIVGPLKVLQFQLLYLHCRREKRESSGSLILEGIPTPPLAKNKPQPC